MLTLRPIFKDFQSIPNLRRQPMDPSRQTTDSDCSRPLPTLLLHSSLLLRTSSTFGLHILHFKRGFEQAHPEKGYAPNGNQEIKGKSELKRQLP